MRKFVEVNTPGSERDVLRLRKGVKQCTLFSVEGWLPPFAWHDDRARESVKQGASAISAEHATVMVDLSSLVKAPLGPLSPGECRADHDVVVVLPDVPDRGDSKSSPARNGGWDVGHGHYMRS